MPRYGRGASAARRVPQLDTESESEDDYDYSQQNANVQRQMEIMMKDLGTATRNKITTNDFNRGGSLNVPATAIQRDCQQKGSKAAKLAGQHQTQLAAWSGYFKTSEAKAAGGEALEDLNGGNSHRLRVRTQLQESGIKTLQDSYIDPRFRRAPGPGKPGRGAAAAAANDRGHFSHSRGGGFAGRGMGRGMARGMGRGNAPAPRPLDPAVDPNREYSYGPKPPYKKPAQVNMAKGKVTVKPTGKPSQSAQPVPARPNRPLPSLSPVITQLDSAEDFMSSALALFKTRAEAGGIIMPTKPEKPVDNAPASAPSPTPSASSTPSAPSAEPAVGTASPDPVEVEEPKVTQDVQHVERHELDKVDRSPNEFTDGQLTETALSGFSPSVETEAEPELDPASATDTPAPAGLGLTNVPVKQVDDLIDEDSPGKKNAALAKPLLASPKHAGVFSEEQYNEYLQLRDFIFPEQVHDFAQWRARRNSQGASEKISAAQDMQQTPRVSITSGYKIGGNSLGLIIGDDRNLAAKPKSTQTTPSLMKSKWASPEAETLATFKANAASVLKIKPSILPSIPEGRDSAAKNTHSVRGSIPIKDTQDPHVAAAVANGTGSRETGGSAEATEQQSTRIVKLNPFAPREDPELEFNQTKITRSQDKVVKPSPAVGLPKKSNHGKGIAGSKWASPGPQVTSTSAKIPKKTTSNILSASIRSDAETADVSITSQPAEPIKPVQNKLDIVQPVASAPVRSAKGVGAGGSNQPVQNSKASALKRGLNSSRWSTAREGSDSDLDSGISTASVLGPIQTNISQPVSNDTAVKGNERPVKEVRFQEPKPSESSDSRNPFVRPDIGSGNPRKSASAAPATTIFGDSRNVRKTAARSLQDPASKAAQAINDRFAEVRRSGVVRDRSRSTTKSVQPERKKVVKVDDELEEGEIDENGVDMGVLTYKFHEMNLSQEGKR